MSELSDYPSSDGTSGSQSRPPRHTRKMIKFGTNVDLSDKAKWKVQLQELSKLPKFLRVSVRAGSTCPQDRVCSMYLMELGLLFLRSS